MSLLEEIRELDPTRKDLRSFGLLVGGIFFLLGAFFWWREKGPEVLYWSFVVVGGLLVLLGAVVPGGLRRVYMAWMSMAVVLGFVMTRVLLTIFFFLVLTPVGLLFRLIGRDVLNRKLDRDAATYWETKEYLIVDRSRFEKFF